MRAFFPSPFSLISSLLFYTFGKQRIVASSFILFLLFVHLWFLSFPLFLFVAVLSALPFRNEVRSDRKGNKKKKKTKENSLLCYLGNETNK